MALATTLGTDMKTAKQREEAFRAELASLLDRHGASLQVTDDGKGCGLHAGIAIVSMDGIWNDDGDLLAEFAEFSI